MIKKIFFTTLTILTFYVKTYTQNPLWLRYPNISPDGQWIVFSYKGDLYKVNSAGGDAQQLTFSNYHEYKPVWSNDGKFIAYSSNKYGNFDIFIIPASGGKPQRLTFHSANEYPTSFSNDNNNVLFTTHRQDIHTSAQFPATYLTELYSIDIYAKTRVKQILSTPAESAKYSHNNKLILYQDIKGIENEWRKHHISSVTRDIHIYNTETKQHKQLTSFPGEDRNPCWSNSDTLIYYLSEESSSFNVYSLSLNTLKNQQITFFKNNPVRFLSVANDNTLCFSYDGEIYIKKPNDNQPHKVIINIKPNDKDIDEIRQNFSSGATEMALSPNNKEIAFIKKGNIFVTSIEYQTTKQITNTPEQEKFVSFAPDGRTLIYASERNGKWNIYKSYIVRNDEPYFYNSTLLKEETIISNNFDNFQPLLSPDGNEIAYLENKTTLNIFNIKTKKIRTVLNGNYNYSYADGDQWFQWSPDSKWLLVKYLGYKRWSTDIALISTQPNGIITNLTKSGYSDFMPKWALNGNAMIWISDRYGMRSHGSWGTELDVFAMFFNDSTYNRFIMSKEEAELQKEFDKKMAEKDSLNNINKTKNTTYTIKIDTNNLENRKLRLTINSSFISDAILSPDGENLYYLAQFEKGYDLWIKKIRDNETKLLIKFDNYGGNLQIDSTGKFLYLSSGDKFYQINTQNWEKKEIQYNAEISVNKPLEREYMFNHVWNQVKNKFYDTNLHNVDWNYYKTTYEKFLPHIDNNFDFAELLSEMLGELNASHTGAGYRYNNPYADKTASLGLLFDYNYYGIGYKVAEILPNSPFTKINSKLKPGMIIEKINDTLITEITNIETLLNQKEGKITLISIYDPTNNKRWDEKIKPVSIADENEMLYQRWIKNRRDEVTRLSNGKIGYVHVRGMNDNSFRQVFSEVFGLNNDKDAIIIDTRFNGGGWLHDDIATLFSGKRYVDYVPRNQYIGSDPMNKWFKKSIMLVSEGNYSDAHGTPYIYKTLGIGKLVGMPVPGTMTAVWWETLIDESLYFGIPQVGVKDTNGNYLENQQLTPDYIVKNQPEIIINNRDQQIEKAVEILLNN